MSIFDTCDVDVFTGHVASPLVQEVVDKFFNNIGQEPWLSKTSTMRIDQCAELSELVKARMKRHPGWYRYKFIVQTMIGQNSELACQVGYAAFWDSETDDIASGVYHDEELCCVVSVFAIYIF